jgi:hypothetical protein
MKTRIAISLLMIAVCAGRVFGQTSAFNGFCYQGGTQTQTSGLPSSNFMLGVIPNCTVTVYLTGTTTLATIYSNASSASLTNPFKAKIIGPTGAGQWLFYAPNGQAYDVVMSGGNSPLTYPSPVTLTGLGGGSGGGGSGPLIQTNGTNNILQTLLNFQNTATVTFSNPSGGIEQAFCNTTGGVGVLGCPFIPLTGTGAPSASCSISNAGQNYYDLNPGVTNPTVYICKLVGASYAWEPLATGGMVYPGAGVPLSTGSAWGTSYAVQGTDSKLLSSGTISGIAGALLCLDASAGATTTGCTVPLPVFQHNGTNLVNQSTINFSDTTPAPPAGATNITFQSNSAGALSAYVFLPSTLQMQAVPPQTGQYVTVYATSNTQTIIGDAAVASSNVWGVLAGGPLGLGGNGHAVVTWSGFTLPSYVLPANVTSVWASATSESGTENPPTGTCLGGSWRTNTSYDLGIAATGTGIGTVNLVPGGGSSVTGNLLAATTYQLVGMTGANVSTIQIAASLNTSGTCFGAVYANVPQIVLYVYYTGTAPPANNNVMVQPPLQFANNTLSISSQAEFPGTALIPTTVNALPDAGTSTSWIVPVTDGVSSTDCTTGGGTNYVQCKSNGSTWSAYNTSGAVSSVSNSDSSLTFSPTTGAVVGSLNVAHANTWTATQTMSGLVLSAITGSTQCLQVNTGGVVSGTGSACGSGSSGISGGTSGFVAIFGSATTITSGIALGTTGSDIPQLSGGLLNNSVINWAAPGAIGSGTTNTGAFTTLSASSTVTFPGIEGAGTYCVQVSATGVLSNTGAACGSGSGAVNSVSNSDSTLVFSPTTGAVVGSLNLANPNTWTGLQTFGTHISIGGVTATGATGTGNVVFSASPTLTGTLTAANLNTSGTVTMTGIEAASVTSCLQISTSGSVTNTGSACGSGGGTLPSNALFICTGSSMCDDDGHVLSPSIAVSNFSQSSSTLTINTTAAHGLTTGMWISVRNPGGTVPPGWPASPSYMAVGTGYTLFQATVTSTTQITINVGSLTIPTCSSSCGVIYDAMPYVEYAKSINPNYPTSAINNTYVCVPTTIHLLATNFTAMVAGCVGSVSGKVPYFTITNPNDDVATCRTAAQVEADYQTVFSDIHAIGGIASVQTATGANWSQNTLGCGTDIFTVQETVELWLRQQNKGTVQAATPGSTSYWDIIEDIGPDLTNANDITLIQTNTGFGTQGVVEAARIGAAAILSGTGTAIPRTNVWFRGTFGALPNGINALSFLPVTPGSFDFQWFSSASPPVQLMSLGDGGQLDVLGVKAGASSGSCPGGRPFCAGGGSNFDSIDTSGNLFVVGTSNLNNVTIAVSDGISQSGGSTGTCWNTNGSTTACGSSISGGASGEVALFGSATTITSGVQLGTSGSDIPQLSGGLLATSILPKATNSAFGAVEGDGATITLSSGVISCTTATTSQLGCVKPDGTTILISGGVISAVMPGLGLPTKSYTSSQTASSADNNYSVVMNCNSCSYTLPATQPSSQWTIGLQFRGTGDTLVLASGASYNSNTNSPQLYEDQLISITANQQTTTDYIGPNLLPASGPTYTAGASVTSCGQASGYTNTNDRGEVTIVGGTATTGTICTVNFSATLTYAPGLCTVTQSGGTTVFSLGHGTPTTSSFTITAGISVIGSTVTADYRCTP